MLSIVMSTWLYMNLKAWTGQTSQFLMKIFSLALIAAFAVLFSVSSASSTFIPRCQPNNKRVKKEFTRHTLYFMRSINRIKGCAKSHLFDDYNQNLWQNCIVELDLGSLYNDPVLAIGNRKKSPHYTMSKATSPIKDMDELERLLHEFPNHLCKALNNQYKNNLTEMKEIVLKLPFFTWDKILYIGIFVSVSMTIGLSLFIIKTHGNDHSLENEFENDDNK